MALKHEDNIREQKKLKLLNQQLQTHVATLQNNSTQTEGDLESNRSPNLHALDVRGGQSASEPDPNYSHPWLPSFQSYPGA